ncbi:unnamed protein product [Microthlaspi erraticum]|uniref:SET domain-containing protein n=1 Tax=Microthlaspi erraticum TaxID=1685480 RepID=A0A6D2HVA9_9BRAS|nr:unnamed protein product [Microthlaspi erraticum]
MASKALSPSVKPQTFKVLQKIDGQFCYEEVLVRLLHFWKVRNFKRGNALIGVESLLHDSENHRELMLVVPKMDVSYDMKSKMEVMLHHTKANVAVGEELTYDYLFGPDEPHECKVPCLCKFASCMKF